MEFCGGHTHAISRYGLEDLLPPNVRLIHGPGCPVCVLPMARVDMAIACARLPGVTLCVYGDLMRVPGSSGSSLMKAKAEGADIRMVYSTLDAIRIAEAEPGPRGRVLRHRLRDDDAADRARHPRRGKEGAPELLHPLQSRHDAAGDARHPRRRGRRRRAPVLIEGFIGPAHVSTVIGTRPYEPFARDYGKPVVIAGFEPLDVAQAILMLVSQINDGRAEVENQYIRAVTPTGNLKAQAEVAAVFETRESFEWRGLGFLPQSALRLRPELRALTTPSGASASPRSRPGTIRPANAARSCAARRRRAIAGCSGRSARRIRRWAPAWSRPKAPARRTGPTAASARTPGPSGGRTSREPREAGPAQARSQGTAGSTCRTARAGGRWGN